jgi:hypothetical protein
MDANRAAAGGTPSVVSSFADGLQTRHSVSSFPCPLAHQYLLTCCIKRRKMSGTLLAIAPVEKEQPQLLDTPMGGRGYD